MRLRKKDEKNKSANDTNELRHFQLSWATLGSERDTNEETTKGLDDGLAHFHR